MQVMSTSGEGRTIAEMIGDWWRRRVSGRRRFPWLGIITAVILLYLLLILRWQIVAPDGVGGIVYRLDRLTGRVEMSLGGMAWEDIRE